MHARSALFDLYGDHLVPRDAWAPVSAVVGLLGSLGISAPATRTAISRLVAEGWLVPEERGHRGYAATARARSRLAEAGARIYRTDGVEWDGRWHLVVLPRVGDRSTRARISRSLAYLGYGQLAPRTWIAPRQSPELDETLAGVVLDEANRPGGTSLAGAVTAFHVTADGLDADVVARVWDLAELGTAYQTFLAEMAGDGIPRKPETAFVERSTLVHRWRLFLFSDPGLPTAVLPDDWPGRRAADAFTARAQALRPAADTYVDAWLEGAVR